MTGDFGTRNAPSSAGRTTPGTGVGSPAAGVTDDIVTSEIIVNSLASIAEEMQHALFRTGYSTVIRESQDASCAILTPTGQVVGQHVVLPLHMGSFPRCAQAVLQAYPPATMQQGDAFALNSPYVGGSPHANDMAVVTPLFVSGELFAFCANIAHKSDIGGSVPGSGPGDSTDIFQEGLQLPVVRYLRAGAPAEDLIRLLRANSRTPELVVGDLQGQAGANELGSRRLQHLVERYGAEAVRATFTLLLDRTEHRVRHALAQWPDGTAEAEGFLDHDGVQLDRPVRIHARVTKLGDALDIDLTGSADHTVGPANIRPQLVHAACSYVLIALLDPTIPPNLDPREPRGDAG